MRIKVRFILSLLAIFLGLELYGQNVKENGDTLSRSGLNSEQELCRVIGKAYPVPVINYEPVTPPKFWKKGILNQIGFSQISLTNWAAGGSGSVALNAYVNGHINYEKGNLFWENRGQFSYGFIQSFEDGYRKSDDKIILDSKFGLRAYESLYLSAVFNFTSQFSPGFEYPSDGSRKKVSAFFSPANFTLGLGIDYKPGRKDVLSINFAPLTGSVVLVSDSLLRKKYGNAPDEFARFELGAQLKVDFKYSPVKNCTIKSTLNMFSDYLNNPQNIQIKWDFRTDFKINKFLTSSLWTNLIYDDNVSIAGKDGTSCPRVQFKEVLSLSFSYTFGEFKK